MSLFQSFLLAFGLLQTTAAAPGLAVRLAATVTTTTPAAEATATYTPGKRGICYNNPNMTTPFGGPGSNVTWMYNWQGTPMISPNSALKYIPMLWSNSADRVAAWNADVEAGFLAGADALLGYVMSTNLVHSRHANL